MCSVYLSHPFSSSFSASLSPLLCLWSLYSPLFFLLSLPDSIFGYEGGAADDIVYVNWLNMVRAGLVALEYYTPESKKWGQVSVCVCSLPPTPFLLSSFVDNEQSKTVYGGKGLETKLFIVCTCPMSSKLMAPSCLQLLLPMDRPTCKHGM